MKIEKNDMVMVYDGGGTVPHCQYTGRFGDLTAYWQEIVSDAVYLFRLGEARSATGWFSSASLGHRIHRTAFAKELKGHRERDAPLFRCNVNRERGNG